MTLQQDLMQIPQLRIYIYFFPQCWTPLIILALKVIFSYSWQTNYALKIYLLICEKLKYFFIDAYILFFIGKCWIRPEWENFRSPVYSISNSTSIQTKIAEMCNKFYVFSSLPNSIIALPFCYTDVLGGNIAVPWLDKLCHACQRQKFCTVLLSRCRRQRVQPSSFSCVTATSAGQGRRMPDN